MRHASRGGGGGRWIGMMGGMGIFEGEEVEENGRTDKSREINSILEEMGLRDRPRKGRALEGERRYEEKSGVDEEEEEEGNKGHGTTKTTRGGWRSSSTKARGGDGGRQRHHKHNDKKGGRGSHHEYAGMAWGYVHEIRERVSRFRRKQWMIIMISTAFVIIQLTTFRRRNARITMDHLDWRARNQRHRHRRVGSGVGYDGNPGGGGLSDAMRDLALGNVVGGGALENVVDYDPRWRRGEEEEGDEGGLGDYLSSPRVHHAAPLTREQHWDEQDEVMIDDAIVEGANVDERNYLRSGGGGKSLDMNKAVLEMDEVEAIRQQEQLEHYQLRQNIAKQQHQQGVVIVSDNMQPQKLQQQQRQQQLKKMTLEDSRDEEREFRQEKQPSGDSHQLSRPKMTNTLDNGLGADKLSFIDPRPIQKLTNDIVPERFGAFADLKTPYMVGRDTPFFWHVPRSGGVVVKTMLSHCLGQTLAAEVGETGGHESDSELKVISFSDHNYTNVNIATSQGIKHALNLGLVPSHLADTIVSAHVDLIPSLFNANDRGRAFVLLRHPVDRAASMFYFLKNSGYLPLKNMTVDDYAKSEYIENNWLVRMLSLSMTGPIDMDNLAIAKEVLRRKFIVGLLDNKRGSFARFDHYFKWKDSPNYEKEFGCRKQLMDEKYLTKHPVRKDSDTWKLLLEQNRFDVHLYDFAKELFSQQSYIFGL
ncbi:hypothetical protein ACHAXA_004259 [Cyclostephanos tholiformis]|uniref:Sulfotransferase domain-containing protein n=1 Tax=Cyclostephanos tholiformis TaxID=382380 RepID=A0ABD3RFJ3_9STRA